MKVYPVVHINPQETAQATDQALHALELGADGIYLIHHKGPDFVDEIFETFNSVDRANPEAFIGVNLLGLSPLEAAVMLARSHRTGNLKRIPDGLWSDDALHEDIAGETKAFTRHVADMGKMKYLGGVAFKYRPTFTEDPALAAELAVESLERVDVVTTSGAGTGFPPTLAKIRAMKQAIGAEHELAVASGITVENVGNYAGVVDQILIASGVETKQYSGVFDSEKLRAFIDKAHSLVSS